MTSDYPILSVIIWNTTVKPSKWCKCYVNGMLITKTLPKSHIWNRLLLSLDFVKKLRSPLTFWKTEGHVWIWYSHHKLVWVMILVSMFLCNLIATNSWFLYFYHLFMKGLCELKCRLTLIISKEQSIIIVNESITNIYS